MKLLFVHQNMPGQYRELVAWLAAYTDHQIVFLTQKKNPLKIKGVKTVVYNPFPRQRETEFGLSKTWEAATAAGIGAVRAAQKLEKEQGFRPDIVIGHAGWGELLFFKDLWKNAPVIGFFEFYYRMDGGLVGFDPSDPPSEDAPYFLRARNAVHCTTLDAVDVGHTPTQWQADRFPDFFKDKLYVCHDGIRTDILRPDPNVSLNLRRMDKPLTREDEVFTFLARNLEHARGYHVFMRALPMIQKARPNARVIVVGGSGVSYGKKSDARGGLRAEMEAKYGDQIDWSRTHFLGNVPYDVYQHVIQISRCHLYLSMPFVLSWSLLESMSMQATVVATDVAPVREVITHGETGMLVDFFDPDALADQVIDVLSNAKTYAQLGINARNHIVENYDFHTNCLPKHIQIINALVPGKDAITVEQVMTKTTKMAS